MAGNQQVHILKLIGSQVILIFPVLAWYSTLVFALQSVLPKHRKKTLTSLLLIALVSTLVAVIVLSFINLPTATIARTNPNLPDREAAVEEEVGTAQEAAEAEAALGASDAEGFMGASDAQGFLGVNPIF
jgi:hypothetical protein